MTARTTGLFANRNRTAIAVAALGAAALVGLAGSRTTAIAQSAAPGAASSDVVVTARPAFAIFAKSNEASVSRVNYDAWGQFVRQLVSFDGGRTNVAYRVVHDAGLEFLGAYVNNLQTIDPQQLNRREQLALWINLHNAEAIRMATVNYPVRSGGDLVNGTAWNTPSLRVSGVDFSLNDLRTNIIGAHFRDPRVLAALVLPAKSSPLIQKLAFTGRNVDAELNAAATQFINLKGVVNVKGDVAFVSPVYTLNRQYFGGGDAQILAHLKQFAEPKLAAKLATATHVEAGDFNWALNDFVPRSDGAANVEAQRRQYADSGSGSSGGGSHGS
ncbi:MAG: DUF547 domain-containing protein [Sphingomonas sp.]